MKWSRLALWLSLVLSLFVLAPVAFADQEATADSPRDVPMAIMGLEVPPLPKDFTEKHVGDWLTIAYPIGMDERVSEMSDGAEAFKLELEDRFAQPILAHVDLRFGRTAEEMRELAPQLSPPPDYAVGVAYTSLNLVLISNIEPKTKEGTNLEETFRHELVHVALNDAVRGRHVPLWFNEGIAMVFSGENSMGRTKQLWDATLSGTILPLEELDRNFQSDKVGIAYAESADFVRFLMRDEDRGRFAALMQRTRDGQAFDGALGDAYGSDTRKLEYQWREELSHRFSIWPAITGGSLLWVIAAGVLMAAWVKRRRTAKQTLKRWEAEEAAAEARARSLRIARVVDEPETAVLVRVVEIPHIEVDGDWHTLH